MGPLRVRNRKARGREMASVVRWHTDSTPRSTPSSMGLLSTVPCGLFLKKNIFSSLKKMDDEKKLGWGAQADFHCFSKFILLVNTVHTAKKYFILVSIFYVYCFLRKATDENVFTFRIIFKQRHAVSMTNFFW